jgi:hypothetical protein
MRICSGSHGAPDESRQESCLQNAALVSFTIAMHKKGILKEFVPRPGPSLWADLDRYKPVRHSVVVMIVWSELTGFISKTFFSSAPTLSTAGYLIIGVNDVRTLWRNAVKQSDVLHIINKNPKLPCWRLSDAPHLPIDCCRWYCATPTLQLFQLCARR